MFFTNGLLKIIQQVDRFPIDLPFSFYTRVEQVGFPVEKGILFAEVADPLKFLQYLVLAFFRFQLDIFYEILPIILLMRPRNSVSARILLAMASISIPWLLATSAIEIWILFSL
jgi:hypothetical protein